MRIINGNKEDARSFDLLDRILADQAFRVAHWKIAFEEINYRRFFDVNGLIGLRVEVPEVFAARHARGIELVNQGQITGLRVDHVDGLYEPLGYLRRLQSSINPDSDQPGVYVIVEKILGPGERLPEEWPAFGTTGYDFLNAVNGIFVDAKGFWQLEKIYAEFVGSEVPFAEIGYARNKQVMEQLFAGEVRALGHDLGELAAQDRQARDVPLSELMQLLVEVTACLPVYRTYIKDDRISPADRHYLEQTLQLARTRTPEERVSSAAFEFLGRVLLLDPPYYALEHKEEWLRFVMRWQQFTGPVMAKGLEDTAIYIHNSLISLNEVGGDPLRDKPPGDTSEFHQFNHKRLKHTPFSLNATSTHDTKRGEDVRARINVLPEIPERWRECLFNWSRHNESKKRLVDGRPVPAPEEEVLIYQTLIGAWPLEDSEVTEFAGRLKEFLIKAAREAKTYTSWMRIHDAHESALLKFVDAILDSSGANRFLDEFLLFHREFVHCGALNSLSQLLLKITSPGVPDFYQGTEMWTWSLVDPDNRRPVDFRKRIAMLEELKRQGAEDVPRLVQDLSSNWRDGRIKMYLTYRALEFRRTHSELFLKGEYIPLRIAGSNQRVCAFARRHANAWALVAAPHSFTRASQEGWVDSYVVLPAEAPRQWRNVLTSETLECRSAGPDVNGLALANVLESFPVALLQTELTASQKPGERNNAVA